MFVREFKQSITLSTVGIGNSCSTHVNGLLHSIRVFWGWNPAVAHQIATFRSVSTGSTVGANILFNVSGTTVSSSETWYEFLLRKDISVYTAGSTIPLGSTIGEVGMLAINGPLHSRITTSSAFAGKVATVIYSLV